jgi:predicted nucleic acid-binding protein
MLLLAEVAGALSRRTADSRLAKVFVQRLETLPYTRFYDIDLGTGRRAATIAADVSLKGSDALYVALGVELGMQLVTWDNQQRQRGNSLILTATPGDLLAQSRP